MKLIAWVFRIGMCTLTAVAALTVGLIVFGTASAVAQSAPPCSLVGPGTSGTCIFAAQTVNYSCTNSDSKRGEVCTFSGACTGTVRFSNINQISNSLSCRGSVAMQSATTFARVASQAGMNAVQSELRTIRDLIQDRLSRAGGSSSLGYAEADPDQVLAYADAGSGNPLYRKAPAAAPAAQNYGLAVWAQGYGDFEQRWGSVGTLDVGRITQTGGVVGGIDKTFTKVFADADALVIGLIGGDVTSGINNADGSFSRLHGPSAGGYLIWVNGGFSIDGTIKADFLDLNQTTSGIMTPLGLTNYVSAVNFNQKYDYKTWWIEPTVGVSDTRTIWDSAGHDLGISDGNAFRVQGGARFGIPFHWGDIPVDATVTTLLYDDVSITGGTLATIVGGPLVPTGEGLIFGQALAKLNFDWGRDIKGLTTFVEAEVRGSSNVVGAGGKLGARYQW